MDDEQPCKHLRSIRLESDLPKCLEHSFRIDGRETVMNIARQDDAFPQVLSSAREGRTPSHPAVCDWVGAKPFLQKLLQAFETLLDRIDRHVKEALLPFDHRGPCRLEVLGDLGGYVPGIALGDAQGTGNISGTYVAWSHASKTPS